MSNSYRDMHKINEQAEALLKELMRYRDNILGDINYYDVCERAHARAQAMEFYGEDDPSAIDVEEFYDEEDENPYTRELKELDEIITHIKKLKST